MKKFSILILVVFLASTVFGAVGSSQFQVLKFSPSVRATSIGDSFSSIVSGADSLYYNPAGVSSISAYEVSFSYTKGIQNLNFLNIAGKMKLNKIGNVALGVMALLYGDMYKVTEENGILIKSGEKINSGDYLAVGNFSRRFGDKISVGVNLKMIGETLDTSHLIGIGGDLGGIYEFSKEMGAGISVLNLGIQDAPMLIRAGMHYQKVLSNNMAFLLTGEVDKNGDSGIKAGLGGEVTFLDRYTLRTGYRIGDAIGAFRMGAGVNIKGLFVDYSFNNYSDLANVHRIGITYKID